MVTVCWRVSRQLGVKTSTITRGIVALVSIEIDQKSNSCCKHHFMPSRNAEPKAELARANQHVQVGIFSGLALRPVACAVGRVIIDHQVVGSWQRGSEGGEHLR